MVGNFLQNIIDNYESGTRLLYRGSRDGWMWADFHKRCDLKGPTITLIRINEGVKNNTIQLISNNNVIGKILIKSKQK